MHDDYDIIRYKMVNYQQGKVYKISCDEIDRVYIGSTCEKTLAQRMSGHKSCFKSWQENNAASTYSSFEILQYPSAVITLIELFPCNSKDELTARERFHIESHNCVNKYRRLNATPEDYKERYTMYNLVNREKIAQYQRDHLAEGCAKQKRYYAANSDKILAKGKVEVICECGAKSQKGSISRHRKSKIHLKKMTELA